MAIFWKTHAVSKGCREHGMISEGRQRVRMRSTRMCWIGVVQQHLIQICIDNAGHGDRKLQGMTKDDELEVGSKLDRVSSDRPRDEDSRARRTGTVAFMVV